VVRHTEIKFSKKVDSALVAFPYFESVDGGALKQKFHRKGHVMVPVNVKLKTKSGDVATHAVYHWFVARL
jgi:hypothetical protein